MKKFLILLVAIILPLTAFAQAQITTKKIKISDFTQKTTKVVLTGNALFDAVLKEEIAARWRISPYEFCTLQEFNELKNQDSHYFLISTKGQFKTEDEPGLQFITLVKGGADAENGLDQMLEIVSLPIASAEDPSGREFAFMPAFLDIIQNHALMSIESDIVGYAGLTNHTDNIKDCAGMRIVFADTDMSSQITKDVENEYFDKDLHVIDEDDADKFIANVVPNTLVSLVIAPTAAPNGSYCYKMIIDSETHKLFYFRRHKLTKKDGVGFLVEDIKKISSHR